jgi:hypothetical protein
MESHDKENQENEQLQWKFGKDTLYKIKFSHN